MEIPEREWFTEEELGTRWKSLKIDRDMIQHYIESGRLKASRRTKDYRGNISWEDSSHFWGCLITLEEVKRFELEHCLDLEPSKQPCSNLMQPYLDPHHMHYANELAVAVKAWLALYSKGGRYKPGRGHINQIKEVMDGTGLSGEAIKRIAKVVNPNKDGGSPVTPER